MTLPASRNTNYAPGAQIKSSDLNDIQDKIIALWLAQTTQQRTRVIGAERCTALSGFVLNVSTSILELAITTAGAIMVPLPLEVGERIQQVNIVCLTSNSVATNITAGIKFIQAVSGTVFSATEQSLGGTVQLPGAVSTVQKIVLPGSAHVVAADRHYYVRVNGTNSAGTKTFVHAELIYDRGP